MMMKYPKRLQIGLVTFLIGVLAAAVWSKHLGQRVWSPRVFAWRNPLRQPPKIDLASGCPLLISNPRYYSFVAIGTSIGGVLRFDITNKSNKLVHSYDCRYYSPVPVGNGGYGSHPEDGLSPATSREDSISAHEYAPLTLTIDFVQFADGDTWFSHSPQSNVKPEGVKAGARAAVSYLLQLLDSGGVSKVMDALPRIHADVREPDGAAQNPEYGIFGFYNGVTNIVVRLEHEYKEERDPGVESFIRSYGRDRSS
jgi:hypothetical protein